MKDNSKWPVDYSTVSDSVLKSLLEDARWGCLNDSMEYGGGMLSQISLGRQLTHQQKCKAIEAEVLRRKTERKKGKGQCGPARK
jgi:hypothetical protein